MLTTVQFTEYDITTDLFHFEVTEPSETPYKLKVSGESIKSIFDALTGDSEVSTRDRCIAMCLEGKDENGDDTGEYTDCDPCELVGISASM